MNKVGEFVIYFLAEILGNFSKFSGLQLENLEHFLVFPPLVVPPL